MRSFLQCLGPAALLCLAMPAVAETGHWAFAPLKSGTPPEVKDEAWPLDFIDHYVLSRIEAAGITPSPEADRVTFIRRLSLDLTGLPPTLAQVESFVRDLSVNAYERIVDQYLNSPHFAEQWAGYWLDRAEYADTAEYANWRWRDWVIDRIGRDVPFDRFTLEQIAGDLLPEATKEQQLASAFHVQPPTAKGEADSSEEARVALAIARTNKTAKVWLGLDIVCARCHQQASGELKPSDFYGFFAFFNNAIEKELVIGRTFNDERQLYPLEQAFTRAREAARPAFNEWLAVTRKKVAASAEDPVTFHPIDSEKLALHSETGNDLDLLEDGSVRASGALAGTDLYTLRFPSPVAEITGFRIETLIDPDLPNNGPGSPPDGNFVLSEFRAFVHPDAGKPPLGQPFLRALADFSETNFEVGKAIDGNPSTGWGIAPEMGKPHHADFILAQPLVPATELPVILNFVQEFGPGKGHLLARFRVLIRSGGKNEVDLPDAILALIGLENRSSAEESALFEYFASKLHPETVSLLEDLEKKRATLAVTVRVLQERVGSRLPTYRFLHDDFRQPDKDAGEIAPQTPACLPPLNTVESATRLDLARWIAAPENPLTARVAVNEIWGHLFGRGLVPPREAFNPGGAPPTHPELLDALAEDFIRGGWSRKKLIRSIVLSRTYRQASTERPETTALDPTNQLLHRQNPFLLPSGILRDARLAVSGLLVTRTGGPAAEDNRRSLYLGVAPRGAETPICPALPPSVPAESSDAADETAEQSAAAMADALLIALGTRTDAERLVAIFKTALLREPDPAELKEGTEFLESKRSYYLENVDATETAIARNPPAGEIAPVDYAAWVATILHFLEMNEFKTRL